MMKYSERYGYVNPSMAIQVEQLDQPTRNLLWNIVGSLIKAADRRTSASDDVFENCYEMRFDATPYARVRDASGRVSFQSVSKYAWIENSFMSDDAYKCFDLIEFVLEHQQAWVDAYNAYVIEDVEMLRSITEQEINSVFVKKCVGCRCVNGNVVRITDENEINAIKDALDIEADAVSCHLEKALCLFADRDNPDYANSIKESISAVESYCKIVTGLEHATLGDALKQMEKKNLCIHPTLIHAFKTLFSFTSDESGIRHGGIKPDEADSSLAHFFLVTCSAFVNYLRSNVNRS